MNNDNTHPSGLGPTEPGPNGFPRIVFEDNGGQACCLEVSSVILSGHGEAHPGTSGVLLGVVDVKPKIMAKHAAGVGVEQSSSVGWIEYPLPPQVHISSRMFLNRGQVNALVVHLKNGWTPEALTCRRGTNGQ